MDASNTEGEGGSIAWVPHSCMLRTAGKKNGERFFGLVGNRYGLLLFFFSFSNLFFVSIQIPRKNASFNNDRACKLEFCTIYSFILFTYPNTFKYIVHIHKQYIQTQYHIACGPIKSAPIFITYLF